MRYNLAALPEDALPGCAVVARSLPFFFLLFTILIGTLLFTSYSLAYAPVFVTFVTWLTLIRGGWERTLLAQVTAAGQVAIIAAVR